MQLYKLCDRDMTAKLIKTDGTVEEIEPKNGTDFTLAELYKYIDCELVQVVRAWEEDMIIICDENGRLNGSHYNFNASQLATACYIVGNAIYCHTSMLR